MTNNIMNRRSANLCRFLEPTLGAVLLAAATLVVNAQTQDAARSIWVQQGRLSYDLVRQGSEFRVAIGFGVGDIYTFSPAYINSNQTLDRTLVPMRLEITNLESLKGLTFSPFLYPKAKSKKFKFSNQPLLVYERGMKQIKFNGYAAPDMPLGRYELKATLTYQACNDDGCGMPLTEEMTISIEIVDPKTKVIRDEYMHGPSAKDFALTPVRAPRAVKGIIKCLVKGWHNDM